jgi:hypothetical protein
MRKGIAFKPAGGSKSSSSLGIAIVFAGMVFLSVTKALAGYKFGNVTALVCFISGALLVWLGLTIAKRDKKR